MVEVERGGTVDNLRYFHEVLDSHFRALRQSRLTLDAPAPVFALEHGLEQDDRKLLQATVVAAHRERLLAPASRKWWLPFVVHAAEIGYIYDGVEYWPIYADRTPGWVDSPYERDRVRGWFSKFANEYGGAIPQGSWAKTFSNIAWPITHAVLPKYLQVQLARMLYDYRTAWPSLLDDPAALGERLHVWSRPYGERLEKFCQNTALLGHVSVALLLSGEGEASPYIESSTTDRLVASINKERQSRSWLHDARHSASIVRTRGFQPPTDRTIAAGSDRRARALTDPKLQLKLQNDVWHAYAVIPDLKPLQHSLPIIYDELRNSRASVAGSREVIRSGALLYALAPVRLSTWPSPREPFLQLKNASSEVNMLIADQCRIEGGPWWVFRTRQGELGIEVKGQFVRPGERYCIVGVPDLMPPDVSWCSRVELAVDGVAAYSLQVPALLSDADSVALLGSGLSIVSDVSIQPVGVVASSWDGEGAAEWLSGEPALIMIRSVRPPARCRLTVDGVPFYVEWPTGEAELFVTLDGLAVGIHEVVVTLGDQEGSGRSVCGKLSVVIRDPQGAAQGGAAGEGIRLRTSPAQPSLPELWDGRAVVEVDGPEGVEVELAVTLRDRASRTLGSTWRRSLELPITGDDWHRVFARLRDTNELARHYDDADAAEFVISRAGVGFATVTSERGFRGLRWVLSNRQGTGYLARLIDRTDNDGLAIEFFPMDHPLRAETQPPDREFIGPPRGGLLWATSGDQVAAQIIPPDPNQLINIGVTSPFVPVQPKSLSSVRNLIVHHRRWSDAELPAHPFGARDRQRVLKSITAAISVMLAPGHWTHFEHQIADVAPEDVDLDRAQELVGMTTLQQAAAKAIASNLWKWETPEALIVGFSDVITDLAAASGMRDIAKGSRFLLQLASSPGELANWDRPELDQYLHFVFTDPVLFRAARFAVLGTPNQVAGGVG